MFCVNTLYQCLMCYIFVQIEDIEFPFDKMKNQRRAFIFITYDSEESCDKCCQQSKQTLASKTVSIVLCYNILCCNNKINNVLICNNHFWGY